MRKIASDGVVFTVVNRDEVLRYFAPEIKKLLRSVTVSRQRPLEAKVPTYHDGTDAGHTLVCPDCHVRWGNDPRLAGVPRYVEIQRCARCTMKKGGTK